MLCLQPSIHHIPGLEVGLSFYLSYYLLKTFFIGFICLVYLK